MKKNVKAVLFLLEFLVCCCFIFLIVQQSKKAPIKTPLSDWSSDYTDYDNGWYIDETIANTNGEIDFIYGPYLDLKKGSYTATVDYITDFEQTCVLSAQDGNSAYIKSGTNKLVGSQNKISFRFTLTEDVKGLEMIVKYDGQGTLRIENIEFRPDASGLQRNLVYVILLFVLFDVCLCFRESIERNKNIIFAILAMFVFISLPLFMKGIASGHDLNVHLMRIEGIAQEIRNGNIPVRISSLWMNGHGYPISIYYGDLLLYIPAVLRIIGFPIISAYKIYVALINIGTVVVSYVCFQKIFVKSEIACAVCLAYVTAGYRFVDVYVRAAVGEYSSIMFLPIVALAIFQIYQMKSTGWKQICKNAMILSIGMTGLIGTHILSTQMVVFVLVLICIAFWKTTIKKETMVTYLLAVAQSILLNLYFIIPFIDYYFNVPVNINGTIDDEVKKIQESGAFFGQYFAFFQDSFGYDSGQIQGRLGLTPGIVLMLALIVAFYMWINKKASKEIKWISVFAAGMLFLASDLFPWNHLAANYKVGSWFTQVQFPWRYISLAIVFLSVLLGLILQHFSRQGENAVLEKLYLLTVSLCLLTSFYFVSDYCNNASIVSYYDTPELDTYSVGGAEYIRKGTDWVLYPSEISQENMKEVSLLSQKGYQMEVYCETGEVDGTIQFPVFNYKGFRAMDEDGNSYKISDGKYNMVQVLVPAGFSGTITLDFIEPWYWRMSEMVSLLYVLVLCVSALRVWVKEKDVQLSFPFYKKKEGTSK